MTDQDLQSLIVDEFFYFSVCARAKSAATRYPHETPEQLARRLIEAKARLTLFGGLLVSVPVVSPGVGLVLELIGMVAGMSALTRMHLYLILEIALV
jgi:hypothetical protein